MLRGLFFPPNVWLQLQHALVSSPGRFEQGSTGQFPPRAVQNGFKTFESEVKKIIDNKTLSESKAIAVAMLKSEFYQICRFAIFILGFIVAKDNAEEKA